MEQKDQIEKLKELFVKIEWFSPFADRLGGKLCENVTVEIHADSIYPEKARIDLYYKNKLTQTIKSNELITFAFRKYKTDKLLREKQIDKIMWDEINSIK